ncbi:MAG: acyl-CoA thioesterase [Herpetosiphonaceae bacterium]|nr:MAG: acyl-CoA thioesterase [Herpetosiphonaceae bacterium]
MDEPAIPPPRKAETTIMTDLVLPNQTNSYGTMFGGDLLALMDKAAGITALRFCRTTVVTASTERLDFRTPIKQGDIVEICAKVIYTGHTSLIIRIDVYAESPFSGNRQLCTTGYFSMVAVDADGRPIPVPPLLVESDEEREDWEHGEEIRREIQARRRAGKREHRPLPRPR